MDDLGDLYYLLQLIWQILIFLRDFVFRKFTWFASTEEDLDNAGSKLRAVAPQHPAADLLVFLAVCGLLFAFMILSANTSKNEASSYDTSNIETISMALEDDPSSFWYTWTARSGLTSCFHACGDSIGPSRDILPKMQIISHPAISNTRMSQPRVANYGARSNYVIKHSEKMQTGRPVSQTTPREWLIRRTRSGHVYGKYPI